MILYDVFCSVLPTTTCSVHDVFCSASVQMIPACTAAWPPTTLAPSAVRPRCASQVSSRLRPSLPPPPPTSRSLPVEPLEISRTPRVPWNGSNIPRSSSSCGRPAPWSAADLVVLWRVLSGMWRRLVGWLMFCRWRCLESHMCGGDPWRRRRRATDRVLARCNFSRKTESRRAPRRRRYGTLACGLDS